MRDNELEARARKLIAGFAARPRPAGGRDEAEVRASCADFLVEHGFSVREEPFTYSALPGHLGVPIIGLITVFAFGWLGSIVAGVDQSLGGYQDVAIAAMLAGLALLYRELDREILRARFMRRSGINLVGVRGEQPRIWLVAHTDTKSQPVPILVRAGGIVAAGSAGVVAVAGLMAAPVFALPLDLWIFISWVGIAGGLTMASSVVGSRSPGAIDNASGVAAALLTAAAAPGSLPLGVLLSSAEELGLAGARAWAATQAASFAAPSMAINYDGLDDRGAITCMGRRDSPLAARIAASARSIGTVVRFRRVLPGILVDSVVFASAGWDAITISKGDLATLSLIHTRHDAPARLRGRGVREAVELVTEVLRGES